MRGNSRFAGGPLANTFRAVMCMSLTIFSCGPSLHGQSQESETKPNAVTVQMIQERIERLEAEIAELKAMVNESLTDRSSSDSSNSGTEPQTTSAKVPQ